MSDVRYTIDKETSSWTYGSTYHGNTFFGKWVKYKLGGKPPTPEQLAETERKRTENAEAYRLANPWEPSKEYHEACKKWPLK
jgi:hypothetical protein